MAEKTLYLDTFIFMDILSGETVLAEKAYDYIKQVEKSGGVVSAILFTELSYHLRRRKSRERSEEVLFYIQSLNNLEVVPVTDEISKMAGFIRAKYRRLKFHKKLTYFDCIHIATAVSAKCEKFVTGDKGFHGINEIPIEIY